MCRVASTPASSSRRKVERRWCGRISVTTVPERPARAGNEGIVVTFVLWNQELEVEQLQRRLGMREPIIEVFSNDPRLANLVELDGPAPRRRTALV